MKLLRPILLIVLLLAVFAPAAPARADAAPPPVPAYGGPVPFGYQPTMVQMVYERVEMELSTVPEPGMPAELSIVSVTAWFVMRNRGTTDEHMQVVFPLGDFNNTCLADADSLESYSHYQIAANSFTVSANGNSLPTATVTTPHPHADQPGCQDLTMQWAGFDVTFPVDEDVLIRVDYQMENWGTPAGTQIIQYVLETGGAWYGSIGTAYLIFRFPYLVNTHNVYEDTTSGYQTLYNEIFWSYTDFEPTANDNLIIAIASPDTWERYLELEQLVEENPQDAEAWLELADIYGYLGMDRLSIYLQGIAANPDNAELHARYADRLIFAGIDYRTMYEYPPSYAAIQRGLPYLNRALALDPYNRTALQLVEILQRIVPEFSFTPPATIAPTITSTSTITPTPTITPIPSPFSTATPWASHTPANTRTPRVTRAPAQTAAPTSTPMPASVFAELTREGGTCALGAFFLTLFALAGAGLAAWWKRGRKQ